MAGEICGVHREPIDPETGRCSLCEIFGAGEKVEEQDDKAPEPTTQRVVALPVPGPGPGPGPTPAPPPMAPGGGAPRGGTIPIRPKTQEEIFFDELKEIKAKGLFAILFVGFGGAGKTWLLHRMKEQLLKAPFSMPSDPEFKRVTAEDGESATLPSTSDLQFHYVHGKPKTFVLIDMPGDQTHDLISADYSRLRMLLGAMDYAKAMIVALPTDLMIFGELMPADDKEVLADAKAGLAKLSMPEGEAPSPAALRAAARQVNQAKPHLLAWAKDFRRGTDQLEEFAAGVFRVASVLGYMRHENIDPADAEAFKRVTPAVVKSHYVTNRGPIGGPNGFDCPTFFALTKADRALSLFYNDENDAMLRLRNAELRERPETGVLRALADRAGNLPLENPWDTIHQARRDLHAQLISVFPLSKFDYATAFYGHQPEYFGAPDSDLLSREHYRKHPPHGVVEVLQWISLARKLGSRNWVFRQHYSWAANVRRRLAGIAHAGVIPEF